MIEKAVEVKNRMIKLTIETEIHTVMRRMKSEGQTDAQINDWVRRTVDTYFTDVKKVTGQPMDKGV